MDKRVISVVMVTCHLSVSVNSWPLVSQQVFPVSCSSQLPTPPLVIVTLCFSYTVNFFGYFFDGRFSSVQKHDVSK